MGERVTSLRLLSGVHRRRHPAKVAPGSRSIVLYRPKQWTARGSGPSLLLSIQGSDVPLGTRPPTGLLSCKSLQVHRVPVSTPPRVRHAGSGGWGTGGGGPDVTRTRSPTRPTLSPRESDSLGRPWPTKTTKSGDRDPVSGQDSGTNLPTRKTRDVDNNTDHPGSLGMSASINMDLPTHVGSCETLRFPWEGITTPTVSGPGTSAVESLPRVTVEVTLHTAPVRLQRNTQRHTLTYRRRDTSHNPKTANSSSTSQATDSEPLTRPTLRCEYHLPRKRSDSKHSTLGPLDLVLLGTHGGYPGLGRPCRHSETGAVEAGRGFRREG